MSVNEKSVLEISKNPMNHKEYAIPEILDDRENIDAFIERNKGKKIVVVQGLGFVGAVMSLVVANSTDQEYAVIGIDLPRKNTYWKIQSINEGEFPIISSDKKIEAFFDVAKEKGNLHATYDPYAYRLADVIIVDINLDVAKEIGAMNELVSFDVDLSAFKKAITSIGANCKEDALVLVETTVPPGSCAKVVYPILKQQLADRGLASDKIKLGHSYERVMPGPNYIDSIQNFYRVYSGIDEKSAEATKLFLKTIISTDEYPLTRLSNTNATEMAKVLENSYRAMNIAFVAEWACFAEDANVNLHEVVKAIRMRPTHKNLMNAGLGVGGYCLTKDPLLASWAKQNLFNSTSPLEQSIESVKINDTMPLLAMKHLKRHYKEDLNGKKILLFGVSYIADLGDTRYTPVELVYNYLQREGCTIELHDPYVNYWEEKDLEVITNLDKAFEVKPDIIILTTRHKEYYNSDKFKNHILNLERTFVLDTWGILSNEDIQEISKKHDVKIIGRGDV